MKQFTEIEELKKDLRKELRSMNKNAVLYYSFIIDDKIVNLKCTKQSIMSLTMKFADGVTIRNGSLWDITQKMIIETVVEFVEG